MNVNRIEQERLENVFLQHVYFSYLFFLKRTSSKADTSLRRTKIFVPDEFLINSYKKPLQSGQSKTDTSLKRTLFSGPAGLFSPEFTSLKRKRKKFNQNIKSQYYIIIRYQEMDRYVAINQVFSLYRDYYFFFRQQFL